MYIVLIHVVEEKIKKICIKIASFANKLKKRLRIKYSNSFQNNIIKLDT